MEIQFTNNQKIQLDTLLYIASNSKHIQNERKKAFFILLAIALLLSFMFMFFQLLLGVITFLLFGIALLIFPKFYGSYYAKSCEKFIALNYKNNKLQPNLSFEIETATNYILIKNEWVESKHFFGHIASISETSEYFFLYLKTDSYLTFPKDQLTDVTLLKTYFQEICEENSIPFKEELNWVWK
ncbi:MAG: hypothetical protein LBI72_14960 [Flavobacteriaceae bacterium]|jgi:hypothetical protein|nr:hypothetical protein [Flavobacteriaceae bacterium]